MYKLIFMLPVLMCLGSCDQFGSAKQLSDQIRYLEGQASRYRVQIKKAQNELIEARKEIARLNGEIENTTSDNEKRIDNVLLMYK